MQTIKRDIYVTKNVLQAPIEVTEGTNSIAIEFDVRDYDIPASAAAVAYSLSTSSMEEPNKALADVSENKITIIPSETFFLPGQNVMQVRIIDGNSKLISFNIIVKCTGKMRFGDEKEEQQSTLVEQMLAKLGEYQKKSASPYNFKGSCLSSELPASGNTINDTYYCTDLKYRKTWNGSAWEQSSLNEADYEDELTKTNGEVSSLKEDLVNITNNSFIDASKTNFIEDALKNYWDLCSVIYKKNYFPYQNTWNPNPSMLSRVVDIDGNETYVVNVSTFYDFYNGDTYLSGGSVEANKTFTTPLNATKARIGIKYTEVNDKDVKIYNVKDLQKKPYFNLDYAKETENKRIYEIANANDKNLIEFTTIKDDYYIGYNDGNERYTVGLGATDYIDISKSNYITVKKVAQFAYYDKNKVYLSGEINPDNFGYKQYKVPDNAHYARFSLEKESTTVNALEAEIYNEPMSNLLLNLYEYNYFDSKIKENYYIGYNDGNERYTVGLGATDYIDISNGEYITISGFIQFAYYDKNKVYLSGEINPDNFGYKQYKVPDNAHYARFSIQNFNVNRVLPVIYNLSLSDVKFIEKYRKKTYTVGKDINSDYNSFSKAMLDFGRKENCVLIVKEGTYNVVDELGSFYFNNYKDRNIHGFQLGGNNKYIFSPNAKVVFNYDGSNSDVKLSFTPFSSSFMRNPSYILDGANIEVRNCRYCIHDDVNFGINYHHIIKNCTMLNHGNDTHGFGSCLGGGLGFSGISEIENCFCISEIGNIGISYHGNAGGYTEAKCKTIIKDCYIGGDKTIGIYAYGVSNLTSEYIITNNSLGSEIIVDDDSNISAKAWNNEIRGN